MKDEPVLALSNVGKSYPKTRKEARSRLGGAIRGALLGARNWPQLDDTAQWAVHDISFRVAKGESLGIIGRNGAGKTTLLRMIAGQLRPDAGEIIISGETGALIALTAGLKMSATGRENIFLKSALLGRSEGYTRRMCDEIIAFSELEDAIDRPVETYSSGMVLRLAFSTIIVSEPDLLVVDEALAVGDFAFKQKCLARIREMKDRVALVLVSHSMGDVTRFCDRVILMENGRIAYEGDPPEAIKRYQEAAQPEPIKRSQSASIIPEVVERPEEFELIECRWTNAVGEALTGDRPAAPDEGLVFECRFILHRKPRRLVIGVPVYSHAGELLCGFSTDDEKDLDSIPLGEPVSVRFSCDYIFLNPGRYRAALGVVDELEHLYMKELPDLLIAPTGKLTWGHFHIPGSWGLEAGGER